MRETVRIAIARLLRGLPTKSVLMVGFDFESEPGLADNGDLEHDLQALLEAVGNAAQKADTALVLFVDELQYVEEAELAALITAMRRCAQRRVPIMLVGSRAAPTAWAHGQRQIVCRAFVRFS